MTNTPRFGAQQRLRRHECACVVPFYNERDRILYVLEVVTQTAHLAQVICVDDGSTDGASALIAQRFPHVRLLPLPHNSGKAAAVRAGVELVQTSDVLLLDADLRGLAAAEIERAVVAALANPEIDMIILRRVKAAVPARLSRGDVLFSGERVVKTADLAAALAANPSRYQIEIALNRMMLERGKRVYWMPSSARNTLKVQKHGPMRGLAGDVAIITGEVSPSLRKRAAKLDIDELHLGVRDKRARLDQIAARRGLALEQVAYIGDDVNDVAVLEAVGLAACPADATSFARAAAHVVCQATGGHGVLREVAELIIAAQAAPAANGRGRAVDLVPNPAPVRPALAHDRWRCYDERSEW